MKKALAVLAMTAVLALGMAAPTFAVTGADGAGSAFGQHHAAHAQEMTGFTGTENPGMHQGFAGWGM